MKTPISYYGGKQKLAKEILKRIPEHRLYCEPFFGGGAIFFEKPKSAVEVINDTNQELINFYKVVKQQYVGLSQMIQITLHSRQAHTDAEIIYNACTKKNAAHLFTEVERAWAVWVLSTQSFSSKLDGNWGYDIGKNTTSKKIMNKREGFTTDYAIRLQDVQIECTDALRIIESRDSKDSFFYPDPPYFNSNCGHYDGYSEQDFKNLLNSLSKVEGKFMLSSYPSDILAEYVKQNRWKQVSFEQRVTVNNKGGKPKKKTEVLTANYDI